MQIATDAAVPPSLDLIPDTVLAALLPPPGSGIRCSAAVIINATNPIASAGRNARSVRHRPVPARHRAWLSRPRPSSKSVGSP
jgi:hypothetical protein